MGFSEHRNLGSTLEEVMVQIEPTTPLCVGQIATVRVKATYELRARYGLVRVFVQDTAVPLGILGRAELEALPGRNVAKLEARFTVPATKEVVVYVPLFEEDLRPTHIVHRVRYPVQPAGSCPPELREPAA